VKEAHGKNSISQFSSVGAIPRLLQKLLGVVVAYFGVAIEYIDNDGMR
jgi:hypothetical protein